jgi:hypothetical protein
MLIPVRKFAIFVHRWMGVAFCVLFAWWFVSGMFMMYWDFPSVEAEDRLARAPAIDGSRVKISASEAWAGIGGERPPDSVRLGSFDGRPAYFFRNGRAAPTIVYADDGQAQTTFPPDMNLRTAAAWTRDDAAAVKTETIAEPDQWTVQISFRARRTLTKYSWPDGQQVYISTATGEVVQYTTTSSRLFAWLGAIPHWLYFTPLRANQALWSQVVIWSSGIATVAASLGLAVGISLYSPRKRYRYRDVPSGIPYTGPKRLHTIFGLFFGVIACTWAFSGMMSMDPFPSERGQRGGRNGVAGALRSGRISLNQFAEKPPREALSQLGADFPAKELELTLFDGEPVYLATGADRATRIVPVRGVPAAEFDRARILNIIRKAGATDISILTSYDAYYLDRHHDKPLPVILARLNDPDKTRYYVDPKTARVVGGYSSRSWVTRWLYHGLHSLDFPWLYNHRPAWDITVLILMLGGVALSVTSVILGVQVLQRKVRTKTSARPAPDGAAMR